MYSPQKDLQRKRYAFYKLETILKTTIKAYTPLISFSGFSGAQQSSRLIFTASSLQEETNPTGNTQKGFSKK